MSAGYRIKNTLFWGFLLWLAGYLAGILLFFIVPQQYIGWILNPIGSAMTIWVLMKKIRRPNLLCYIGSGFAWVITAVLLDYVFIVRMFNSGTSYYKPDVYVYYLLTLALPITIGYWKKRNMKVDDGSF